MENQLKKQLVAIKENGAPPHLTPKYRNMVLSTIFKVNFLGYILMKPDADIGTGRRQQAKGFLPA